MLTRAGDSLPRSLQLGADLALLTAVAAVRV